MEVIIALIIVAAFIIGSILEVSLISAPGAFIRRLFSRRKKSFKELYKEYTLLNYFLGFLVILILFVAIVLIVKLFL
jgi:triphosphoribosyl-dephospho-CoA synthetase